MGRRVCGRAAWAWVAALAKFVVKGKKRLALRRTARAALLTGIEDIQEIYVSSFASFAAFAVRDRDVLTLTLTYGVRSKPGQRHLHTSKPRV
jgi:hypothetical protein